MFKSIKAQIISLAVLPLIGAIFLGAFAVYETYLEQKRFGQLLPVLNVATIASDLIHELQKERGKSAGMISGDFKSPAIDKVTAQRALTNRVSTAFTEIAVRESAGFKKFSKDVSILLKDMEELEKVRTEIDGQSMTVSTAVKAYTHMVHDIIKLIAHVAEMSPSEEVSSRMLAFLELIEAKEAGGLERAIGAVMLNDSNAGNFDYSKFLSYMGFLGQEQAYINEFKVVAPADMATAFDSIVSGKDVERVAEIREVLKYLPQTKDTKSIEGNAWFATATKRLGLIKQVSDSALVKAAELASVEAKHLSFIMWELAAFTVFLIILSIGLSIWQIRSISKALGKTVEVVTKLAKGEIPEIIPMTDRTDQIGDIARASETFRDNLVERGQLREAQAEEQKSRVARQQRVDSLIDGFRVEARSVQETVTENMERLQGTTGTLIATSEITSKESEAVATASEEASANVQTVAAAAEQMAASIGEIDRQVAEASRVVNSATEAARTSNEKVTELSSAAIKIGDVVSLIQDIAEQTNLLALNATIEAARAGDSGKGFAVVASEVKALASQTSSATDEIASQIGSIQSNTEESANAIRAISEQMEEVNTYTNGISAAVEQQGKATQEISTNVQRAAQGTQSVSETIASISGATLETNKSANDASAAANSAVDQTGRLNSLVDSFLTDVAAA